MSNHSENEIVKSPYKKMSYTEEQIIKIWGGNFMRVFKEVEKYKTTY